MHCASRSSGCFAFCVLGWLALAPLRSKGWCSFCFRREALWSPFHLSLFLVWRLSLAVWIVSGGRALLRRYPKGRSFTGFAAEVWFEGLSRESAVFWSSVVGDSSKVRQRDDGCEKLAVSVPCVLPNGIVRLDPVSRGARVILVHE